jgi:hypothetical protein
LKYLDYGEGLIKVLSKISEDINSIDEIIDNDDDIDYEPYEKLGGKYAELYFNTNYIKMDNITEKNIAKIINEFLNSKLSYGLFMDTSYNIKYKSFLYII